MTTAQIERTSAEVFEPQLRLVKGIGGTLILHATTLTPNSCYVAGEAEALPIQPPVEPPPVPDDVLPVNLHIKEVGQICIPTLKPVDHRLGFNPGPEIERIRARVIEGDEIVGEATISIGGEEDEESTIIDTRDWQAWIVEQKWIPETRVDVEGTVVLPSPGYAVSLVEAEKGEASSVLSLELKVEEKDGWYPPVVTPRTVWYSEYSATTPSYAQARILLPSGKTIDVPFERKTPSRQ